MHGDKNIGAVDLDLLGQCVLFSKLQPEPLAGVLQSCRRQTLPAKQVLFHRGDAGQDMFVILNGGVKVSTLSSDGKEIIFDVLGPSDFFGELSLLDGRPRTGTITTLTSSHFLVMPRTCFFRFLEQSPQSAVALLQVLANRLRQMDAFLEDVLFLDVEARLAKRIMALARIYGRNYGASVHIDLKMSQQELANLVGISRESVNKYFKAWEKERVIASQQGCIVINQLQVLQSLAAGQ